MTVGSHSRSSQCLDVTPFGALHSALKKREEEEEGEEASSRWTVSKTEVFFGGREVTRYDSVSRRASDGPTCQVRREKKTHNTKLGKLATNTSSTIASPFEALVFSPLEHANA